MNIINTLNETITRTSPGIHDIKRERLAPKYHNIVFLHDYQDEQVAAFLDGDMDDFGRIIAHLSQWDYGTENEHSPADTSSGGYSDESYEAGDYILSWNTGLGYVGLERITY